jgi:hypothetical protein
MYLELIGYGTFCIAGGVLIGWIVWGREHG